MEMPEPPLLSSGTNYREFEYYNSRGNYLEKESMVDTVRNYLNEVELIPVGSIERMKVVHVLYEFLIRHKEWCWNRRNFFRTIIGKIYSLKKEKLLTENDRKLLDHYRSILAPKPDFVSIPEQQGEPVTTIFSVYNESDLSAFYRYFYTEYLFFRDIAADEWSLEEDSATIILLWQNSKIIGYAHLLAELGKNWLSSLHIKKENRRKGSGKKMIHLLRKQVGSFWVASTEKAIGFYQRCGGQQHPVDDNTFYFPAL